MSPLRILQKVSDLRNQEYHQKKVLIPKTKPKHRNYGGFGEIIRFEPVTNLAGRTQNRNMQADFILPLEDVKLRNAQQLWPVENEPHLSIFYEQTSRSVHSKFLPREDNLSKLHDFFTHFQYHKDINMDKFRNLAADLHYSECLFDKMCTTVVQLTAKFSPILAAKVAGFGLCHQLILYGASAYGLLSVYVQEKFH